MKTHNNESIKLTNKQKMTVLNCYHLPAVTKQVIKLVYDVWQKDKNMFVNDPKLTWGSKKISVRFLNNGTLELKGSNSQKFLTYKYEVN